MEIFKKQLISVDIERHLELPNDTRREALPPFQGAREIVIPIMFVEAGMEVDVHCSCRSGRLAFTKGWIEIARHLILKVGDVVTLHREDQGGYKMKVRSAS
ncbi:hypothetical protein Peur_014736 [Populus x canadensis]